MSIPTHSKALPAVLHLIDTGGPGGAETIFTQLAHRMGAFTKTLAVIPREDWLSANLRQVGIDPIILSAKGSFNLRYLQKLTRIARARDVRLIHTHLLGSAVYGAILGLMTRTPVLSVLHGPTDLREPGRLPKLKARLLARYCSRIVAVSESTRNALETFGINPEATVLVQNGIDTHRYTPGREHDLRNELRLNPRDLLIGAVGNIRKPKAYDDLIEAAARTMPRHTCVHLVIVGQGEDIALASLRSQASSHGLADRIHFVGFRRASPELYRNLDIFVSSSRSEGLSLAFLEAMSSGLPIVATRSGGPQEVIEHGRSGLLVPVNEPDALGAALDHAISDPDLRIRLGTAARSRVMGEYSLESTLSQYESLYRQLLRIETWPASRTVPTTTK